MIAHGDDCSSPLSGRQDSNLRPPGPKPGAMTGLRYAPGVIELGAVGAGFEPAVQLPVRQFSKLLVSASHPSHHCSMNGWQKYENIRFLKAFFEKIYPW
ncbi:MAG: hypothetical protein RLZZ301_1639 [Bacteroidota bacterium]